MDPREDGSGQASLTISAVIIFVVVCCYDLIQALDFQLVKSRELEKFRTEIYRAARLVREGSRCRLLSFTKVLTIVHK